MRKSKKVILTERQIKYLIEYHHSISKEFNTIFDKIIKALEKYPAISEITFSREEVSKSVPEYNDLPLKNVNVSICTNIPEYANTQRVGDEILMQLNYNYLGNLNEISQKKYISHEFTHYIQTLKKEIYATRFNKPSDIEEIANNITYGLSKIELSAQLSSFSFYLDSYKEIKTTDIYDFDSLLQLKKLDEYLTDIENDVCGDNINNSLVAKIYFILCEKEFVLNNREYNRLKKQILNLYKKNLESYKYKAKKILSDHINGYNKL